MSPTDLWVQLCDWWKGRSTKWREGANPDYLFDYLDAREFLDDAFSTRAKYVFLYLMVLKSFVARILDVVSAITLLTSDKWSNAIFEKCGETEGCIFLHFKIAKWIFLASILISFVIFAFEVRRSRDIIRTRNIPLTLTDPMSNKYWSLRSYAHFCLFEYITDTTKRLDDLVFRMYFAFQDSIPLILVTGPRQVINAITLYAVLTLRKNDPEGSLFGFLRQYGTTTLRLTVSASFTVVVFMGSLLILVLALLLFPPIYIKIGGNLSEYCKHRFNKRIAEALKYKRKQRIDYYRKELAKEAKDDVADGPRQEKGRPTLPDVKLDDDDDYMLLLEVMRERVKRGSAVPFPQEDEVGPPVSEAEKGDRDGTP